jgi:ketosteroid isomerase-like protein
VGTAADIETVRAGIEAFNRGDTEGLVAMAHPDLQLVPIRSLLEGGEYRGHEGIRRYMADMEGDWADRRIEIDEIRELPEGVLVLGELTATGRSGTEVHLPVAWHARFRDGLLIGLKAFSDRETALRELGTH